MKIGVLGGGQLARMLALAGYPLGLKVICYDPAVDACAKQVTEVINGKFIDKNLLQRFLKKVELVTFETENIPLQAANYISNHIELQPNLSALKITQDRLFEKNLFKTLNIPTVDFWEINSQIELESIIKKHNFPLILKTRKNGYDGKNQSVLFNWQDASQAWLKLKKQKLILETLIKFDAEVSLIAVRSKLGDIRFYPLVLNQHNNGILRISKAPYLNKSLQQLAEKYALQILHYFNYVGVMAIEFFVKNDLLIANEIAPRVHNSGHWTIEGAQTSQFENHLRAITGLPLGDTSSLGLSTMYNCITKEPLINEVLKIAGAHYHTYGKKSKLGRKLGHINLINGNHDSEKNLKNLLDK